MQLLAFGMMVMVRLKDTVAVAVENRGSREGKESSSDPHQHVDKSDEHGEEDDMRDLQDCMGRCLSDAGIRWRATFTTPFHECKESCLNELGLL
ncbi:unnamed protein product [Darwinula stevensoni]|uniref:Secreted protein n=1 Tax=Darwinula stevensoni TaxID=69355 RepID=A0A7R9A3D0_9CRUS|nr:unnamed protein product [Darwinula stevensoni]CAG0881860.1 unnamed protein product [Darwinula stevensoni]